MAIVGKIVFTTEVDIAAPDLQSVEKWRKEVGAEIQRVSHMRATEKRTGVKVLSVGVTTERA